MAADLTGIDIEDGGRDIIWFGCRALGAGKSDSGEYGSALRPARFADPIASRWGERSMTHRSLECCKQSLSIHC